MPIRKYRSVDEMPEAPARRAFDPENLALAWSLSEFCYRLRPWRFVPGVHKHRSLEEANRRREEWQRTAVARERG